MPSSPSTTRCAEERNEALSALADTEYDADGSALVTVRASDVRHMLSRATARVSIVVGDRLDRAPDERGEPRVR